MTTAPPLRPCERDALIQSLRAGVTPLLGTRHIQVGRDAEIAALEKNLDHIADGGSAFRLVIGQYGSGKTFFMNLVRGAAMDRQLVVAHADLNPSRRLHSSGGEARSLYAELMKNLATRTKPEGGALQTVVEKFITTALATKACWFAWMNWSTSTSWPTPRHATATTNRFCEY